MEGNNSNTRILYNIDVIVSLDGSEHRSHRLPGCVITFIKVKAKMFLLDNLCKQPTKLTAQIFMQGWSQIN